MTCKNLKSAQKFIFFHGCILIQLNTEKMDWEGLRSREYSGREWDQRRRTRTKDKGPAGQALNTPRTAGDQECRTEGLSPLVTPGTRGSHGGRGIKSKMLQRDGPKPGWMTRKLTGLKQRNESDKNKSATDQTTRLPEKEKLPSSQLGKFPVTCLVSGFKLSYGSQESDTIPLFVL